MSESAQRRYRYQSGSFLKYVGLTDLSQVTQEHVTQFRKAGHGLSPVTVENYIKAVSILTKKKFNGDKLRAPQKRPRLVPLSDLSKVFEVAKNRKNSWMCRFLKFAYITGFRLGDLLNLTRDQIEDDAIVLESSKVHKLHIIPRHFILRCRLPDSEKPLYRNEKTVRRKIAHYCEAAGVPYFTPHQIRRTAITQYELAHPGAGMILHGEGLRTITMRHYIDQYQILKAAQDRLAIPESMLPKGEKWRRQAQDKELLSAFHRLPDEERRTILKLVSRAG